MCACVCVSACVRACACVCVCLRLCRHSSLPIQPAGPRPLSHLFDGEVVDEVVVVLVEVAVQGHAVALVEQVLQRVDPLHAQRALQAVLQVGVVEDDVEAEHLGAHRHRLARPP